jgi:hypothetical protein
MGSEDQVLNLMRLLDDGIQSAEKIEDKLDFYDSILQVQSTPDVIEFRTYLNHSVPIGLSIKGSGSEIEYIFFLLIGF